MTNSFLPSTAAWPKQVDVRGQQFKFDDTVVCEWRSQNWHGIYSCVINGITHVMQVPYEQALLIEVRNVLEGWTEIEAGHEQH